MKVTIRETVQPPVKPPIASLSLEEIKPDEARALRMILLKVSSDSDPKFYQLAQSIAGLLYVDPETYVSEGALVNGSASPLIFKGGKGKQ